MEILGQDKLIENINRLTLDTLPHTLMLLGDMGSGKHTICEYISNRFNLPQRDITDTLTMETIDDIMLRVEPYLYLIRAKDISIKEENVILKFLEEPLKNAFIVILCDNKSQLLPTIINRCQVWELEKYNKDTLKRFITVVDCDKDLILDIVKTPGKVKEIQYGNLNSMVDLCNLILDKIGAANFSNTLTISDKIAWKDEQNKFDFNLFIDTLVYCSNKRVINDNNPINVSLYKVVNELSNSRYIPNISRKTLLENYLYKLREVYRGV